MINPSSGEGYIRTYTGKYFYPSRVEDLEVDIIDIAHALSNVCRYNGHLNNFYSVAQHCVIVSEHVPEELALTALLHDASEAYLPDMPGPIKRYLPDFIALEEKVERHIFKHFGIDYPLNHIVKAVDVAVRGSEMKYMSGWNEPNLDIYGKIIPWNSKSAEGMFLQRFAELTFHD